MEGGSVILGWLVQGRGVSAGFQKRMREKVILFNSSTDTKAHDAGSDHVVIAVPDK